MANLDEMDEKLDWLVEGVKFLLGQAVGDEPLDEDPEVAQMSEGPPVVRCTHQHQAIDQGNVVCRKCGALLVAGTGIKQPGQRAQWLARPEG